MSNIPKIRFNEFNKEWKKNPLSHYLYEHKERNYDAKYGKENVLSVSGDCGIVNQIEHLGRSYAGKSVLNYHIVQLKDIVYTKSPLKANPYGIIKTNKGEAGIVSTLYAVYRCKDNIDNIFLDYYFSLDDHLNKYLRPLVQKGAKNDMKINNQKVLIDPISIPSKQEQEKIASFLTSVDTKIQQLTKKEELLSSYKKGVMQKIFSGDIRFKADDGSEFTPWEEKKLGDVGTTFNGLTGKTSENFGTGKPYIQYKQIFGSSKISLDGFGYVSIAPNERQNKAQFGDIFFTTSSETPNEVAFASVLLDDINEVYLNSFCFGYRAKSLDVLNPYFARFLFRSSNFRREAIKLAQGSTRYNISKVELMKTLIQLPCLAEQTKIANFLSSIDSKIEQVQKQLDSTKEFKKALLQQMFV